MRCRSELAHPRSDGVSTNKANRKGARKKSGAQGRWLCWHRDGIGTVGRRRRKHYGQEKLPGLQRLPITTKRNRHRLL
eukprot:c20810_g1_i1 orf=299-532(+)